MKKPILLIIVSLFIIALNVPCYAMQVIESHQLAQFNTNDLWGEVRGVRTTGQWGKYVRFRLYMPDDYTGKIQGNLLIDGQASNINFSFLPGGIIKIFEFKTINPNMIFWIIKDNSSDNKGLTYDFYLIGPYKGSYTKYVTMDNLVGMGWSSVNMKVRQLITKGGWPVLQGYSDNGNSLVLTENLVLSWDPEAIWFKMDNYPLNTPVREIIPDN
ncbi:hypothetical protein [Pectinatus sottacetonis]|uniref:hypothetical protein n=1 Tax=Pectinatus sottacetonis TaxID=1002795 RepID=UPI0018C52C3B|nr:hypothetical protein [Pectinatus sottacetonis]